jgi:cytochrome c551
VNSHLLCYRVVLLAISGLLLAGCQSREQIKTEQYNVAGERAYAIYCANCHQAGGEGMANLYPPLHFPGDKGRFIQIVKHGLDGEITVNGTTYNRAMPPNPGLTDLTIAEITTFIYNKWGEQTVYTPIDTVKKVLREFPEKDLR